MNSYAARPPKSLVPSVEQSAYPSKSIKNDVLFIDLNNFATFPTFPVGILVARLRQSGFGVEVLCPLAYDVPASVRERKETWKDALQRRIRMSSSPIFQIVRPVVKTGFHYMTRRPNKKVLKIAQEALSRNPDILLISAYLQHQATVIEIAKCAREKNIPLLIGGPVFNLDGPAEEWRRIPGVQAVVGAETDTCIGEIVAAAIAKEDLLQFPGVTLPGGETSKKAAPFRDLDDVPVPDYSDFPWDRYPFRVLPIMTGRGCQWGKCTFCNDVLTANGRTFRTRSVGNVLNEMKYLATRHQTTNFIFLDIKLNSFPAMFRGISEGVQEYVPGAQWIGTVHVDQRKDNGLTARDLRAAANAGMRRVSFGLETGSQRLLDMMKKDCTVEKNIEFLHSAYEAGISLRCSMFFGYPGETHEDIEETVQFLKNHGHCIDRIRLSRFAILESTPIYDAIRNEPDKYKDVKITELQPKLGAVRHVHNTASDSKYRRAKRSLLEEVSKVNSRELRSAARVFDGLM